MLPGRATAAGTAMRQQPPRVRRTAVGALLLVLLLFAGPRVLDVVKAVVRDASSTADGFPGEMTLKATQLRFTRDGPSREALDTLHVAPAAGACRDVRRFGAEGDGGWDVCVDRLPVAEFATALTSTPASADTGQSAMDAPFHLHHRRCVVYSFGVNDNWSFDTGMAELGCDVYAYDPSLGRRTGDAFMGHPQRIRYHAVGLAAYDGVEPRRGWPMRTLRTLMAENGHRHVDVVKADVEGHEWSILADALAPTGILRSGNASAVAASTTTRSSSSTASAVAPPSSPSSPASLAATPPCLPFGVLTLELHLGYPGVLGTQARRKRTGLLRRLRDDAGFAPYATRENWRYCQLLDARKLAGDSRSVHEPANGGAGVVRAHSAAVVREGLADAAAAPRYGVYNCLEVGWAATRPACP